MRGGVTCRQCHGEHIVIARLCRTEAFGPLVDKKYWRWIRDEKWASRVRLRPGSIRQRSARWRSRETKHRQQHADRTKTKSYQGAGIKKARFRSRIFSHKSILLSQSLTDSENVM